MNFLVKIPAGEKDERVKAPMRFTNSKKFAMQMQSSARRGLDMCQAQSGFTHSPHSPADFCLKTHVFKLAETSTAACRKPLSKFTERVDHD